MGGSFVYLAGQPRCIYGVNTLKEVYGKTSLVFLKVAYKMPFFLLITYFVNLFLCFLDIILAKYAKALFYRLFDASYLNALSSGNKGYLREVTACFSGGPVQSFSYVNKVLSYRDSHLYPQEAINGLLIVLYFIA